MYSDADIRRLLPGSLVIPYTDLYNYATVEDLLDDGEGRAVILYEVVDGLGHWVVVFESEDEEGNDQITYFDSYGLPIDDPLSSVDPAYRLKSWEDFRYLSMLLAQTDTPIDYNNHALQARGGRINTCGRWAVARAKNWRLSSDDFAKLFLPAAGEKFSPDELVTLYTDSLERSAQS